jgi:hypothetical protein
MTLDQGSELKNRFEGGAKQEQGDERPHTATERANRLQQNCKLFFDGFSRDSLLALLIGLSSNACLTGSGATEPTERIEYATKLSTSKIIWKVSKDGGEASNAIKDAAIRRKSTPRTVSDS